MADYLTDADIAALVGETKRLPPDFKTRMRLKTKRGHVERELSVLGDNGGSFVIMTRQSRIDPSNFSVILAFRPPSALTLFRLRRYNGFGHWHTNRIEGDGFAGPHIHMATYRYQERGGDEDGYAEPTDRFGDIDLALECLLLDCSFVSTSPSQGQEALWPS